jgi:excinuclease ABC subunit C
MTEEPGQQGVLREAARNAPREPGVYIWRDGENRIIYIGKARNLRSRLGSYFSGAKDVKTAALLRHGRSIETIIVSNEYEALLLENTLIKQHSPRYNINLKDGKTYPVIRVTAGEFPRIFRTRRIVEDGSLYFGPFANVQAVDRTLALIDSLFPLRKCRRLRKRSSPCLYYHISRCMAPCCGRIDAEGYEAQVREARRLLESAGSGGEDASGALVMSLTRKMHEAARALKFERAAQFRNAIDALRGISASNSVADRDGEARDYIAWAQEGIFTAFAVLSMRGGRMTGRDLFCARSAADEEEAVETFVMSYYSPDRPPPQKIFIGAPAAAAGRERRGGVAGGNPPAGGAAEDQAEGGAPRALAQQVMRERFDRSAGLERGGGSPLHQEQEAGLPQSVLDESLPALRRWFREQLAREPEIAGPGEPRHDAALAMARQNAAEELRRRLRERGSGPALDELAKVLGLKARPERIEGFDIAQLDGKHPVASLIAFKNGVPDRKNYRCFKLKTVMGVVDDFAAMREAVRRRYSRLQREGRDPPHLVLVDGGIGQVNAAKGVLDELGVDCAVAGLAKRDEEVWLPGAGEPVRLPRRSEALKTLQFVRDETHRFATGLNQRLRSKDIGFAVLESLDGIGPARAEALMRAFGSLEKIAAAGAEEVAAACGASLGAARAVRAAVRLSLEGKAAVTKRRPRRDAGTAAALAEEALGAGE